MSTYFETKTTNIQYHENSFRISRVVTFRRADRKEKRTKCHFLIFLSRTNTSSPTVNYIAAYCCPQKTECLSCSVCTFTLQILYKNTFRDWTVLTVITPNLPLHVQLHNITAHLLYKYCTNCTVRNWTVLTVITQKLLLNIQLHKSTTNLMYNLYSLQMFFTYSN